MGRSRKRRTTRLIALVRQPRQRMEFDALLVEVLGFLGRRFAEDRAVLDLAVMHLARFLGEFAADILRIPGEVVAQFLQLAAESPPLGDILGARAGTPAGRAGGQGR